MHQELERALERWVREGVLDPSSAERLREHERDHESSGGMGWPVRLALGGGALLVSAGTLLFVSAHWDDLSPAGRFSIVLALTALFHVAGATVAARFAALATSLHAVGTGALGGGIYMSGQIFNLAEHWPGGLMAWGLGAVAAWALLRDAAQATFAAILIPAWLVSEWSVLTEGARPVWPVAATFVLMLALVYASAARAEGAAVSRRILAAIGALAFSPAAFAVGFSRGFPNDGATLDPRIGLAGGLFSLALPLVFAVALRSDAVRHFAVATVWVGILAVLGLDVDAGETDWRRSFLTFLWIGLGGILVYFWGSRENDEPRRRTGLATTCLASIVLPIWAADQQPGVQLVAHGVSFGVAIAAAVTGVRCRDRDLINAAVPLFAFATLSFYFAAVMDRLGRSASLFGLGSILLFGGWSLERARRRLLIRAGEVAS